MNREAVKTEINNIIEAAQASIRYARQHATSKKYIARLTELGIIDLMPAKFGNTDAQAVIAAAEDNGKMVGGFNAYGEGDVVKADASTLYTLLNEVEVINTDAQTEERAEVQKSVLPNVGDSIRVLDHTRHQSLSHGAVISPMIEHERKGYETTVRAVYRDIMEDEHGNEVIEYTIEDATGQQYSPDQIEVL